MNIERRHLLWFTNRHHILNGVICFNGMVHMAGWPKESLARSCTFPSLCSLFSPSLSILPPPIISLSLRKVPPAMGKRRRQGHAFTLHITTSISMQLYCGIVSPHKLWRHATNCSLISLHLQTRCCFASLSTDMKTGRYIMHFIISRDIVLPLQKYRSIIHKISSYQ